MMSPHRILTTVPLVAALLLAGCASTPPANDADAPDNTPTLGVATGPVDEVTWYGGYRALYSLDPTRVQDIPEMTVLSNVCESLVRRNTDNELEPAVASAYTQVDDLTFEFTLRDGVTFFDGNPVTIDDVVYSLQRNLDPAVASAYAATTYANVESVEAIGDTTVAVTLSSPDSLFLQSLAGLGGSIVEQAYVEETGLDYGSPAAPPMCTGPFEVASYDGSSRLELEKNEAYWDADHAAHAERFTFLFPANSQAQLNALSEGEIDGAFGLTGAVAERLERASGGRIVIGPDGSSPQNIDLVVASYGTRLSDPRLRQALSLALDRQTIATSIYRGTADPLKTPAGSGLWGYEAEAYASAYEALDVGYDAERATELAAEAGGVASPLELAYPAGNDAFETLAQSVQQTAAEVGIEIELNALPGDQMGRLYVDPVARDPYDLFFTASFSEFRDPLSQYNYYARPGAPYNYNGYDSAEVTAGLQAALAAYDDAARAEHVIAAQEQIAADLPWIPIVQLRAGVWLADDLAGAPLNFTYMSASWAAGIGAP